MKNLVLLAAALMAITAPLPVMAAETDGVDQVVTDVSLLPARMLGVTAGIGLGVPVAATRATIEKTGQYRNSLSQTMPDPGSPANVAYSTVLAVPGGLVAGLIDGAYYGCKNALTGFEHPFSSESFSLGDDRITE